MRNRRTTPSNRTSVKRNRNVRGVLRSPMGIILVVMALSYSSLLYKGMTIREDTSLEFHQNGSPAATATTTAAAINSKDFVPKESSERGLLEPMDCKKLLDDFRMNKVKMMKSYDGKIYMTRTVTDPPFIVSMHNETIDKTRWTIFDHGKYYEGHLTRAIIDTLKAAEPSERVFLDVGGNIGWFSLVAKALGAMVYTFEPNDQNLVRYCQSLQVNNWLHDDRSLDGVEVYDRGVNDVHGVELDLWKTQGNNPGSFSFEKRNKVSSHAGKMRLVTLDAWAEEKGLFRSKQKISFMKVDVEGLEDRVFKGAYRLLQSKLVQNLAFEYFTDWQYGTNENDKHSTFKFLYECGYVLHKHGLYKGPRSEAKPYKSWQEAGEAFDKGEIGQNMWFKLQV